MINLAAGIEGHPDNSTPALTGGLVTAVIDRGRGYYVKQEIRGNLHFVSIRAQAVTQLHHFGAAPDQAEPVRLVQAVIRRNPQVPVVAAVTRSMPPRNTCMKSAGSRSGG